MPYYSKRFRLGRKRTAQKSPERVIEEQEKEEPSRKFLREEVFDEGDNDVAGVDAAIDRILSLFLEVVEPGMSDLIGKIDADRFALVKEAKLVLDEGVYPYLQQFVDLIDQVMGEHE